MEERRSYSISLPWTWSFFLLLSLIKCNIQLLWSQHTWQCLSRKVLGITADVTAHCRLTCVSVNTPGDLSASGRLITSPCSCVCAVYTLVVTSDHPDYVIKSVIDFSALVSESLSLLNVSNAWCLTQKILAFTKTCGMFVHFTNLMG